jgi:localization factor PodJL
MADSERTRAEHEEAGGPATKREELDQLLHRIATHIAEVDKAAGDQAAARDEAPSDAGGQPVAGRGVQEARAGQGLRRLSAGDEPPVLRSALAAGETDRLPQGAEAASPDETGAAGSGDDHVWDKDSAEALTRSYEAEAAVPPLRSMLNVMAQSGPAMTGAGAARPMQQRPLGGAVSHAEVDAAQTRLFEAARRVETMLEQLAPRDVVEALGHRFTALESRVEDLGGQLTDDKIVALFGPLVPTAEELTQFAEDAAGRAAERVLEAYAHEIAPAGRDGAPDASLPANSQLASLGELLAGYMEERRRNDAGTFEALETLQLAMQHLLDRIEKVDGDAAGSVREVADRQGARAATPLLRPDDDLDAQPVDDEPAGMVNLTANQGVASLAAQSYSMPAPVVHDLDDTPALRGGDARLSMRDEPANPADRSIFAEDEVYAPPSLSDVRPAAQVPEQPEARAGDTPPMSDRQAFIAMARKAAERAKAEADGADKAQPKAGKAAAATGERMASLLSGGMVRPGVMLVAIAAILFAGFWLLFGSPNGLLRHSEATAIEEAAPVATAPVTAAPAQAIKGSQPDIDASAPGQQAPEADAPIGADKTSGDGVPAFPPASLQEANAGPAGDAPLGPGMVLAFGASPATYDNVVHARETSRLANLSQRAAWSALRSHGTEGSASAFADGPAKPAAVAAAPKSQPQPVAPRHAADTSPIETAAVPRPDLAEARPAGQTTQQLPLPPATAGPLSLRLAAAKGEPGAQLEIATRLAEGKGVRQNFAEAAKWYERAAEQGQPIAQYRLATLYERGMGVTADRAKARALYEQAAGHGNLKAMHNLAVISAGASPSGGAPDYNTAARLFDRAAQHGLHDSQYNLGVLYESGLGVPKDHASAYKWYTLAAKGGDKDAARRRDMLISRLPPETLQAMDAQIAAWRPEAASETANNARLVGSSWSQSAAGTRVN